MSHRLLSRPRRPRAGVARPPARVEIPLRLRLYVLATMLLAAAAAVAAVGRSDTAIIEHAWLIAPLAVLVALEGGLAVRLRKGPEGEAQAHEEAFVVFMALLLPPSHALAALAAGVAAGQLATSHRPLKAAFNTAQFVGSGALGFLVVATFAPAELGVARVLAALAGVLVFSLANRALVAGALAFAGGSSFRADVLDHLTSDALFWAGSVSIGLLAGIVGAAHPWALPFALAAMLVLSLGVAGHGQARREREALGALVDSSPAAIFSVDRDGRVQAWNPEMARLTDRLPAEAVGSPVADVVSFRNPDRTETDDLLSPSRLAAPSERRLLRVAAAGGGERWLTVGRAGLPDGGYAFVGQDVTEQREAESAIRESEERLRLALDAGAMGWWDTGSGELRWSENLERIYGLEPGGFGGTYEDYISRVHPDDREFVERTIARGLAEGRHEFVHRIVWPDESIRWLEGKGRVVADSEGHPVRMAGVAFDVTEREQTEALTALQARALEQIAAGAPLPEVLELLMRLVEAHSDGVLASVLLLDEDGLHLRQGAAPSLPAAYSSAIDGVAIGPAVGSCGTAAYRGERVVVADIATDPLWDDFREFALGYGLRACWSEPILASSGDVLGTFAMYYREPRAPSAEDLKVSAAAAHVASIAIARAQQESRLDRAEARHRRLVEQLPLAVYIDVMEESERNLTGKSAYFSPQIEAMLGYSPAEWRADPELFTKILHRDDRERVFAEIRQARAHSNRFRSEYRLMSKDGREVWIHDEAVYLRDDEGALRTIEGYFVDVSERKALESDLLQAQKMEAVGSLAGGVAHDFNNMMSAVIGFGELVLARLEEDHPLRGHVAQMKRAGEQAAEITQQLLAFSRKQVLQPKVLDLNTVVTGAQSLLERLIREDVELACILDPKLDRVEADPGQLEQVIVNLAVNARDAMPEGGKLTIETANVELGPDYAASHVEVEPGPYVLLAVSDTGTGMDAQTRARIFEPFFTTKEEGKGTGLGLATVFGIVKQSGGHIAVYSEPGQGTTFRVYLRQTDAAAAAEEASADGGQAPEGRETVLVVEDEELVRSLEHEVLTQHGYTVLESSSPADALELVTRHEGPIDLLLTDVVMPGMSGRELAERLGPLRPEMRVLYTSGYAGEAIVRHGVLAPGIAFLPKPVTPNALAHKVREVLDAKAQTPSSLQVE